MDLDNTLDEINKIEKIQVLKGVRKQLKDLIRLVDMKITNSRDNLVSREDLLQLKNLETDAKEKFEQYRLSGNYLLGEEFRQAVEKLATKDYNLAYSYWTKYLNINY